MILAVAVMARSAELDNKTLNHKLIMGYQGWFACPGDGRPDGNWVHWFTRGKATARTTTVDLLPDVSELDPDERCKTPFMSRAGHPIEVFSSQNPKTVMRHFRWMKEYGIDGVALQRFIVGLRPDHVAISDRVLDNVRRAAEANGRGFFIMYDVAGADSQTWAAQMEEDWRRLQAEGITRGPAYLSHRGHPVVAIAGFGSEENRPPTPVTGAACLARMREISKAYGGVTLFGTLPGSWRKAEDWASVYRSFDVVSPWTVGRFADNAGADRDRKNILAPDLAEARQLGIDYMPVVFPGFSWLNLMTVRGQTEERHSVSNQIRRNCGDFYWHQVENAVQEGATMLYGAMFDEVDEGTAMFKIVANRKDLPDSPPFVPLDADGCALPSDWYLQLASKTAAMLHGELKPSGKLPLAVPGERK
jgi:hypothetical protein